MSWLGASSVRRPSASSVMTWANEPMGDRAHTPTTTRRPDVRPKPQISPSKRFSTSDGALGDDLEVTDRLTVAELCEAVAGDRPHLALQRPGEAQLVVQEVQELVVAAGPGLDGERRPRAAGVVLGAHLDDPRLHVPFQC